jgi:hypothetical protein
VGFEAYKNGVSYCLRRKEEEKSSCLPKMVVMAKEKGIIGSSTAVCIGISLISIGVMDA